MTESLAMIVNLIDHFGFVSEEFSLDLTSYRYDRKSFGNLNAVFENKELRLCFTLEKGQLYLHAASSAHPNEWYSLHRLVRYLARRGETLSADDQNTDYWRYGQGLASQYAVAAAQLRRVLSPLLGLFTARELEMTRAELRPFARALN